MSWLRAVRANPETVDDVLLEGHLNLIKELLTHVPAQIKYQYGAHPEHRDSGLIKVTNQGVWTDYIPCGMKIYVGFSNPCLRCNIIFHTLNLIFAGGFN